MVAAGPDPSGWASGQVKGLIVHPANGPWAGKPLITSCSMAPQAVAFKLDGIAELPLPQEGSAGEASLIVIVPLLIAVPPSPRLSPARKTSLLPFGPTRRSWTSGRL